MSSLQYPPVDNSVDNLACEICDLVTNNANLSAHYSVWAGIPQHHGSSAGERPPVWTSRAAAATSQPELARSRRVVTSADSSYVHYIQQN